MAILVLLLWAFTAGAGIYLLFKGPLTAPPAAVQPAAAQPPPAAAASAAGTSGPVAAAPPKSRDQWAPPSLVAARQAPAVPGARAAAEFAHPAAGVIGLGFWLGFT